MKFKITIGLLFFFNVTFGQSQQITRLDGSKISASEIDNTVNWLMDTANVHGLDLAILNDKKIVFIKSYGYKDKTKNELLDTSSIMYGASFSKAVFSFLIMKLVERNLLDLDKPLYQYLNRPLPEYDYFSDLKNDDRWKLITARMCLSHTTGLPNVKWLHPTTSVLDTSGKLKIYFTPGTKYAYSGEGFKLLQLVQEEITKKSLEEFAIENVFIPIKMTRSGYIWQESFGDANVAVGHLANGGLDIRKKRTKAASGATLVTTISDYARFIEYVMQGKGLSKQAYKEMFTPQIDIFSKTQFPPITFETTNENRSVHLAYGLGWGLLKTKYGKAFFKEGYDDAYRNYNINFIEKGISIIIMTNSENGEKIFKELLETLIGDRFTPWKWEEYYPYNYKK